jgi:hypothetical protein
METAGDIEEEEEDTEQFSHGMSLALRFRCFSDKLDLSLGRKKKKVVFMPCYGSCLLTSRLGCLSNGLMARSDRHDSHHLLWRTSASRT